MKQTKIKFYNRIEVFLINRKNGLLRLLQKSSPKLIQAIANPDQTGTDTQEPLIDAEIVHLKTARFSPEEEAIDNLFSSIHTGPVKDELYQWVHFGLTEKGKHFADLTPDQFVQFTQKLPLLISALYSYYQYRRKEASNGA